MSSPFVLFVDDDANLLREVEKALRLYGIGILTSGNALEALQILAVAKPTVIISDLDMPAMSGIDFLKLVKQRFPDVMRVLTIDTEDVNTFVRAVNEGEVYRLMVKPIDFPSMLHYIEESTEHCDEMAILRKSRHNSASEGAANLVPRRPVPTVDVEIALPGK